MTQLENKQSAATEEFEIHLPQNQKDLAQNEEWFELRIGESSRRLRFHDYDEIYSLPGLYERLFYDTLECDSPKVVSELVAEALKDQGREGTYLRVLDVGAGNGMVGEELAGLGAKYQVGVDIIPEAGMAAERDRPEVYDDYLVTDLTALSDSERDLLRSRDLNCLVSVAALGFDDIPPKAFSEAFNVIETGGLVAFCLKEEMVSGDDSSGFSRLIDEGIVEGAIEIKEEQRYRHRLSASGNPLYYVAMVGEKRAELPSVA